MHLLFALLLAILLPLLVWETLALIFWLLVLACRLIVLPFLLLCMLIAAFVDLHSHFKRRRLASTVGLDAVTIALEPELARGPVVTLTRNAKGIWEPRQ
jgi:hypothetical protein